MIFVLLLVVKEVLTMKVMSLLCLMMIRMMDDVFQEMLLLMGTRVT